MNRLIVLFVVLGFSAFACSKKKQPTLPDEVAEPESEPDAPVTITQQSGDVTLQKTIYFGFDNADLSDTSRAALSENAEWMKKNPGATITIEGHTDEQGTSEYNIALGDRRAYAARDYLVRMGVAKERIKIVSYGEEKPAVPGDDAQNRRGEFIPSGGSKE